MWNSARSVKLSLVCTRLVILIAAISAVLAATPYGRALILLTIDEYNRYDISVGYLIVGLYYACCVPAVAALLLLDRLLSNITKGKVFTEENVKALRAISWCCFAEAFILAIAALYFAPILFAVAIVTAFFGLILRVVKNVIDAAVALKTENDFTI
jgi:hypothetical protein